MSFINNFKSKNIVNGYVALIANFILYNNKRGLIERKEKVNYRNPNESKKAINYSGKYKIT